MTDKIVISTNQAAGKNAFAASEVRGWIKTGKIFKHLFRYREATLLVYDLQVVPKPFISSLLIKLLGKNSWISDEKGQRKKVTYGSLVGHFFRLLKNHLQKGRFLRAIRDEVKELGEARDEKRWDFSGRPLYLRTDHFFGIQSGGSVGHIAGVLNHLKDPIFFTTCRIPTVKPEIETEFIFPGSDFADFKELPAFRFNQTFFSRALKLINGRELSFIYQRYSVNNFSGVKLAKHLRVPLVLEYNGSELWVSRWWGARAKYEHLMERIERLNLAKADLIVVVSKALKEELVTRGIESNKILVNPNGVNPDRYSPEVEGDEMRKRYGLEGKIVLGFIGTFGKWHGAEVLAEAFGRLMQEFPHYKESVRLLLIGDGITMPQVKEILARENVLDFSTLTLMIPQEEGPKHLAACDILVSPHIPNPDGTPFFGSPTKLFEYMAMGKGIVASDLDQIGEILQHRKTAWMVEPGNVDELKRGLKTLIEDQETRRSLGEAARSEAIKHYTWQSHTQRILDRLKSV